jgi:hypothetical protein
MKDALARAQWPVDWLTVRQTQTAIGWGAAEFTNQKSSGVALFTSSNSETLIELGDRPGADLTARLLLALTALYVQRPTHTVEEQQQYVELALRLIDKVEATTRTAVVRILQRHPDAPCEVVARLGGRQPPHNGDPVREPQPTQDQHCADNQRFDSTPDLADRTCASRPTPPDALAVRQPAPLPPEFGEVFFAASSVERRRMLSWVARGYDDDVQSAHEDSGPVHGRIDEAALPGQFLHELGRLIDIPSSLCERILNDPSGEPMVIAAKAAGMPIAMLQRILLLLSASASYSVQRVYDLTELYHGLNGRAARDILALWRTRATADDPVPETGPDAADRKPEAPRRPPYPLPRAEEGRVGASLRSRFGALTERVRSQAVNARPYRGSVARRGLQSR